ncbi:RNA polymerase sigma-70 factor (ECF subfamily) [Rhizobium sp. ERR 922]|uniref:RNA polymerase sigma factor n=1 Tax=Rhizobium dioscoreae TaxID=2653122 RepID=A0ABQ0Z5T4_9HYPH|nr:MULTISPECIES: sigma-70 family RNA polymerase sigma factor [Rhizobium]TWB50187.1 RNA polymerase sigma-70 factor (ECF subfamily) [Rhizobium sp. ERR 922]TWB92568.1 RNA polymerase sigma-70 factor (ECF subfamily) [Rhizobium sp. ERR 942]GES50644.1 DNA-directed RNA polymerase sigma-70 factor [Rhizobium dioscoreae]GLU81594.1 DNA-directed RNA polymerase sigma-70 factor [Rhizobium sp. NBRC 114257]
MASEETEALIGRIAMRDQKAFAVLYKRTSPKLLGVCLRIVGNKADAEEVLQEVYIKVWQRAEQFAVAEGPAMAWLMTIARNRAIDFVRARKPVADEIDSAYDLADLEPGPEEQAIVKGEGRRIDRCMEELEADRARAVRSAYVEGLSYQELADQHAVPLNTMRTWLRRSLIRLRECMDR